MGKYPSLEEHYYSRPEGARKEDAMGMWKEGLLELLQSIAPVWRDLGRINTLISLVSCRYLPQANPNGS